MWKEGEESHYAGNLVRINWEQLTDHQNPTVRDIAETTHRWWQNGYAIMYFNESSDTAIRFGMLPRDPTDLSTLRPALSLSTAKLAAPTINVYAHLLASLVFIRQFPEPDPLIPDGQVYGGTFQKRMTDVFAQALESAQTISTETGIPVVDVLVDPQLTALPPAQAYLRDTTFYADTGHEDVRRTLVKGRTIANLRHTYPDLSKVMDMNPEICTTP